MTDARLTLEEEEDREAWELHAPDSWRETFVFQRALPKMVPEYQFGFPLWHSTAYSSTPTPDLREALLHDPAATERLLALLEVYRTWMGDTLQQRRWSRQRKTQIRVSMMEAPDPAAQTPRLRVFPTLEHIAAIVCAIQDGHGGYQLRFPWDAFGIPREIWQRVSATYLYSYELGVGELQDLRLLVQQWNEHHASFTRPARQKAARHTRMDADMQGYPAQGRQRLYRGFSKVKNIFEPLLDLHALGARSIYLHGVYDTDEDAKRSFGAPIPEDLPYRIHVRLCPETFPSLMPHDDPR